MKRKLVVAVLGFAPGSTIPQTAGCGSLIRYMPG